MFCLQLFYSDYFELQCIWNDMPCLPPCKNITDCGRDQNCYMNYCVEHKNDELTTYYCSGSDCRHSYRAGHACNNQADCGEWSNNYCISGPKVQMAFIRLKSEIVSVCHHKYWSTKQKWNEQEDIFSLYIQSWFESKSVSEAWNKIILLYCRTLWAVCKQELCLEEHLRQ